MPKKILPCCHEDIVKLVCSQYSTTIQYDYMGKYNLHEPHYTVLLYSMITLLCDFYCLIYRKLDQCYPHIPTKHDFVKSMNSAREGNSNYLYVLDRFNFDQKRLRIGGVLLPDLVEFYQWIHTHLSHIVTFEKAKSINIGKVIDLSTRRYSQEECSHLKSLFERVKGKKN